MSSTIVSALAAKGDQPPFTQPILNRLLDVHERFAKSQPGGRRAMIKYLQAPRLDLGGRCLVDADFTGANFEGARLARANFERASLYCADLRGADARGANFRRADIRGATLRDANLTGANLDEADMRRATLVRVDLDGEFALASASRQGLADGDGAFSVDLTNCSMKGAKLNNARLKGANFSGVLLQGADLQGADLTGANFSGAIMADTNLVGAKVDAEAFVHAVQDPSPEALDRAALLEARVKDGCLWVTTSGAQGRAAMLDGEDLRPLKRLFAGLPLTALSARSACAISVDFSGAQLQGAHFDDADLRDATFAGADLRGASFRGAVLWHANFDGADVRPLALAGGSTRALDLQGAQFVRDSFRTSIRS